jgi:hypothetical protein
MNSVLAATKLGADLPRIRAALTSGVQLARVKRVLSPGRIDLCRRDTGALVDHWLIGATEPITRCRPGTLSWPQLLRHPGVMIHGDRRAGTPDAALVPAVRPPRETSASANTPAPGKASPTAFRGSPRP